MTRVAVIGGGLSGLTAAYQLATAHPEVDVVVCEAGWRLGGKLRTIQDDKGHLDLGAEAYLAFREDATAFFEQLGLGESLRVPGPNPASIWVGDGVLHTMPRNTVMGIPACGADVADLVDEQTQARIDAEGQGLPIPWERGEDANLGELVAARMGQQVLDHCVTPLLGGVYSTQAQYLGLRATNPELARAMDELLDNGEPVTLTGAVQRVLDARKARNEARVAGGQDMRPMAVFHSFAHGYGEVLDALEAALTAAGVQIRLNSPVIDVMEGQESRWIVRVGRVEVPTDGSDVTDHTDKEGEVLFDRDTVAEELAVDGVIVATPAPTAARQLAHIAPVAADILANVRLASSVVLAMRFESDEQIPMNSGVLISPDAGTTAKAITFSSRKWPHYAEQGGAVVRASFGHFADDSLVGADLEVLRAAALEDLHTICGVTDQPSSCVLQRWWGGLPAYEVGHEELMTVALREIESIPGLAVAGAVWDGVGVPACIATGRAAADAVASECGGE